MKTKTLQSVAYIAALGFTAALVGLNAERPTRIISPLPMNPNHVEVVFADYRPETNEQAEIAEYIREVFGKDADKAFKLLSCENTRLNPKAVNAAGNYPEGSRDIGVFQINEHWQRTQGKFLFNWKINVQIAKQLFDENGGSFKLWTCGRRLGV